ncbi:hypothetical protein CONLIGDRAFT_715174 [Coniochaeta ligniaria NRRL 30616]|uniref:Uncharacterized protein n=1 Tax=Coniochaeta ligniaria NRRL 30616 TaxID=1408157 RepID=A0A1J7IMJ4_9PEZI|nr:hypothetical protein CONLIGDRAFT_715174 [Coniochaeta ligniaria NRRL 30616]
MSKSAKIPHRIQAWFKHKAKPERGHNDKARSDETASYPEIVQSPPVPRPILPPPYDAVGPPPPAYYLDGGTAVVDAAVAYAVAHAPTASRAVADGISKVTYAIATSTSHVSTLDAPAFAAAAAGHVAEATLVFAKGLSDAALTPAMVADAIAHFGAKVVYNLASAASSCSAADFSARCSARVFDMVNYRNAPDAIFSLRDLYYPSGRQQAVEQTQKCTATTEFAIATAAAVSAAAHAVAAAVEKHHNNESKNGNGRK